MEGWTIFETELGWMALAWSSRGLRLLRFTGPEPLEVETRTAPIWVQEAAEALTRHLAGESVDLGRFALDLQGLTPFARRVLEALRHTKLGEVFTYGHLARLAGSPGAARAVGQVMARNPLPIFIPCHRVVASNGPGGFSLFGNLDTKERLMALER
ncbi:MAG: methylated-DNA--[protein]-cysteine S-methyltransferase [Firmicutes bacterium]|nr:methylated-DNA--[protein]-cysteine S-methyltransferase [Bacillota bacterium]